MLVPIAASAAITGSCHQYSVSEMLLPEVCLLLIHILIIWLFYFLSDQEDFVGAMKKLYALSLGLHEHVLLRLMHGFLVNSFGGLVQMFGVHLEDLQVDFLELLSNLLALDCWEFVTLRQ